MSADRWLRLMADLQEAGYLPRLDEKPYTESYYGQVRHGVSRSIFILVPGKGDVSVSDKWWHKNPDKWVGWEVCAEDREGITVGRPSRWTKDRSQVVVDVREAMARITSGR